MARYWYELREADQVAIWRSQLGAAQTVYGRVESRTKRLQRYLAHDFSEVDRPYFEEAEGYPEGINRLNLMSRVALGFKAGLFDVRPSVENPRTGDLDDETATFEEVLLENVMAEGRVEKAWEKAATHMLTVGTGIVWTGMDSEIPSAAKLMVTGIDLADFVAAVSMGEAAPVPLEGMNLRFLMQLAQERMGDEIEGRALAVDEQDRLMTLVANVQAKLDEQSDDWDPEREKRHRIYYKPLHYGVDLWWDSTVYDFQDSDWIIRRIPFDKDAFERLCGPADSGRPFKTRAAKDAKLEAYDPGDGFEVPKVPEEVDGEATQALGGQIIVYELWIKSRSERRYFTEGCDYWINHDHGYPFQDTQGFSWMPGWWPLSRVTPIEIDQRRPEASVGVPPLYLGEDQQIDMLRTRTAYTNACKRSGRIFEYSSQIEDDTLEDIRAGRDGTMVPRSINSKLPAISLMDSGKAPTDLLEASDHLIYDFAAAAGMSMPALTGQPVADTLGQEQIAVEAVGQTTAYIANKVQDAVALTAEQTRAYCRNAMSKQDIGEYVSAKWVEPSRGPQGEEGPSVVDKWKASSPKGDRLKVSLSFDQKTRDLAQRKQTMDWVELVLNARDSTGMPYADPLPFLERAAKQLDQGTIQPYQPTEAERMAIIAKAFAEAQGGAPGEGGPPSGNGEARGGPDAASGGERGDNRLAGGKRGPRAIPNRQSRGRGPSDRTGENSRAART